MDILSPEQRSRCMSSIRGKDTKPELMLRKALWAVGLRYRLRYKLPGRPDIVFPRYRVAIFVDGCFWHKCPVHFHAPEQNEKFWADKIARNVQRDQAVDRKLRELGWHVVRFWEHEVMDGIEACLQTVILALNGQRDED